MISSKEYSTLDGASNLSAGKAAGPFVRVFITGQPRAGMIPGTMSAVYPELWNDKNDEKYLVKNKTDLKFVIMFFKKVKELKEHIGIGKDRRSILKWFSFNPDQVPNAPEGSKNLFIIAGALLGDDSKAVVDKIDPTRTAFIHFRCDGIKVGKVIEYCNELSDAGKDLPPLSDNVDFEKKVVLPKRFITKVTVTTAPSSYGDKYVFEFKVDKKLPDEAVIKMMDRSSKWLDVFNKQFDVTDYVKKGGPSAAAKITDEDRSKVNFDSMTDKSEDGDDTPSTPPVGEVELGI